MTPQTHEGLVSVVTGGNRGLGRVMALALAEAGSRVVITGRDARELDAVRAEASGSVHPLRVDVTDADAPRRIVEAALESFGRLDVLINNAGISVELLRRQGGGSAPTSADLTADEIRQVLEVNTIAPIMISQAAIGAMRTNGGGRIVNVTTSLDTMWRPGLIPYGGSKAACEANSVALALEVRGLGITVNILTPGGPADTQIIGPGLDRSALIRPEVMAAPLLWLTGPEAADVTATRVVAARWRQDLPAHEAARLASAPGAWQSLGSQAVYPGATDGAASAAHR